jgi:hypothetical protein
LEAARLGAAIALKHNSWMFHKSVHGSLCLSSFQTNPLKAPS